MPKGYSRNKPSMGQLPPGNYTNMKNKQAEMDAPRRRMRRRRKADASGDTIYDKQFISARCTWCDNIFAGPHRGERVKFESPEYWRIERENMEKLKQSGGTTGGGITDVVCNKRSCIDESTTQMYMGFQERYPEKDFSEDRRKYLEEEYAERNRNTELYAEGLIDDVEPPL